MAPLHDPAAMNPEDKITRLDAAFVESWVAAVFASCGMPSEEATTAAAVLTRTSLRGIDTHGVTRLASYVDGLRAGRVNPTSRPRIQERHGILMCSGDRGLAQAVMPEVVCRAAELAQTQPVQLFLVRGVNHLDAIGMFALPVAERGMVAIICKTTPPLMAPIGSHRPAIGNNPLSFALPLGGRTPLVYDAAASAVGRSKLHAAAADGASLVDGWAIDRNGAPTRDPTLALEGSLLPAAGYKGIGLAMLVQCLAGSLSATPEAEGGDGIFGLIINPALVHGRAAFDAHTSGWLETYLSAAGKDARYPGARAAQYEHDRRRCGLPLSDRVIAGLQRVAHATGCPLDIGAGAVLG